MGQLTYTTQEVQDRLDAVGTLVRPNLLDNAYFVGGGSQQGGGQFPINQRGQTSYTTAGYTIDRWYTDPYGSSNNVTLSSNGLFLASGVRFRQNAENLNALYGRTACVSILLTSGEFDWRTIRLWNEEGGVDLLEGKVTVFSLSDSGTLLLTRASITIAAVKLELGDTQTLAHQDSNGNWVLNEIPNYQQELAKCQRFAIELVPNYDAMWGCVGSGTMFTSDSLAFITIPLPTTMRTVPTISKSGNWTLAKSGDAGANVGVPISSITVDHISNNAVTVVATPSSGNTLTNSQYDLWRVTGATHSLFLSADL